MFGELIGLESLLRANKLKCRCKAHGRVYATYSRLDAGTSAAVMSNPGGPRADRIFIVVMYAHAVKMPDLLELEGVVWSKFTWPSPYGGYTLFECRTCGTYFSKYYLYDDDVQFSSSWYKKLGLDDL